MAKFEFYQDELRKVWYRNVIEVEAETREEAIALISGYTKKGLDIGEECEQAEWIDGEMIMETSTPMTKEENNGRPTLELLEPFRFEVLESN